MKGLNSGDVVLGTTGGFVCTYTFVFGNVCDHADLYYLAVWMRYLCVWTDAISMSPQLQVVYTDLLGWYETE